MTEKSSAWREEYHFANCVIRSDTRELLRDGVVQKIERRSFDLILYLLKLDGRVASKDELLEHVWGNHFVSESVIAQSIMKVRKALGITGKEPGPIKTIHRVGYRFASEVRKASPVSSPPAPVPRPIGPSRVLWLPTECALPRADLSWVRYGLISVATHVLHGHGVPTVPTSEAIRLHESLEEDGGDWAHHQGLRIREIGMPAVRSRMTLLGDQFQLEWRMQIDGIDHGNQIEGPAPAELALRAAREVALIARMQSAPQPVPGQEAKFWEEASRLVLLAATHDQADTALPLMAICIEMPQCPLPIWAEFVLVMAQRADAATPSYTQRLAHLSHIVQDSAHEGWAGLCNAVYQLHQHNTTEAVEMAMGGVALVRHAAPHACHARALLLASHVLATAGHVGEARSLWREAATVVSQAPAPELVSRVHQVRCELDHVDPGPTSANETSTEGMAASRWLGLTSTTAWIHVLQGLQSCARGEWEVCQGQLETGLKASQNGGLAHPRLFAHLQLGVFHARSGGHAGLATCLEAVNNEPALRSAPMGCAVGRWLQARQCYLAGDVVQALPLAEAAMEELADFGVWGAEDQWIFIAQLALMAGNRRAARALLQRLQMRHVGQPPRQTRQATALAVEGMVEYAEGNASKALVLLEHAHRLARGTLMANILLCGLTWLALIDGRSPSAAHLAPAGQWVEFTREGRYLRAMLLNKPYWAIAQRQSPVLLGTADRPTSHRVADVEEHGHAGYAHYLPLPV